MCEICNGKIDEGKPLCGDIVNKTLRRRRESRQGYLFNYNIEEHHV